MITNAQKLSVWGLIFGISLPLFAQVNSPTSLPKPTPYSVTKRDANSAVWERTTYEKSPDGKVIPVKHHYTELATGLNYKHNGQWIPSKEEIDILPDGTCAAIQGQHQAYFPPDIATGVIEVVTPDGKHLQSRPIGLSYDDGNRTVFIAILTNSVGELVDSNQVIYPNAFEGADADLRYTYTKAGFEQDVVVEGQLPPPQSFGLNPETTKLEVLTEFFDNNTPQQTPGPMRNGLRDETLTFGKIKMVQGRAFSLDQSKSRFNGTPTYKSWLKLSGRNFLVEDVPYPKIAAQLSKLPVISKAKGNNVNVADASSVLDKVSAQRLLPPQRTPQVAQVNTNRILLAKADIAKEGVVLDYVTIDSDQSDFIFSGDTTYFISGMYNVGNMTIEGGTVLKFDDGAALIPGGIINCETAPYRPGILTCKNDDSVGESINGSTGDTDDSSWSFWYYGYADAGDVNLKHLRFSHTDDICFDIGSDDDVVFNIADCQFVDCGTGIENSAGLDIINLRNVLFAHCDCGVDNQYGPSVLNAEQVTADASTFDTVGSSTFVNLTNSIILGSVDAGAGLSTNCVVINPGGTVYQIVGGGSYYLTNNSPYRDIGTTNIDPTLLADLATKTTYPPIVYSNVTISTDTTLTPQAQRDTDTPDLGYHYDPLDYAFAGVNLCTNLTATAGTAVGLYSSGQPYSLSLSNNANFTATGTATEPCWLAFADSVQEGGNGNWTIADWMGEIALGSGSGGIPQLNARFTEWSNGTKHDYSFCDNWDQGQCSFSDCEFWTSGLVNYEQQSSDFANGLSFTNCLFYRNHLYFYDEGNNPNLTFENCTFYGGQLVIVRQTSYSPSLLVAENNIFDGTAFPPSDQLDGNTNYTIINYNAYNTNNLSWQAYIFSYGTTSGTLQTVGVHDVMVGGYNWQSSWFGDFYLPDDSPLIDAGSTTADQVALYHFTTQTNQIVETNSTVDIGYHYVATDEYGNPLDSNGNGIPDYLEDVNGNGQSLTIALTSPTNNAYYREPATIPLQVSISDWRSVVTNVSFYRGTIGIAGVTNAPFGYSWPIVSAG